MTACVPKEFKCYNEHGCHVLCDCETDTTLPGCQCKPGDNTAGATTASSGAGSDGGTATDGVAADGGTGGDSGAGTGGDGGDGSTSGTKPDKDRKNTSCQGACEWYFEHAEACQCDLGCFEMGDCCPDFETVCADLIKNGGTADGGTDSVSDGGGTGGGPPGYKFPQPYKVENLSYNDCKGITKKNFAWCDTFDCKAIVKWEKTWCTTGNSDCQGIAAADRSWCSSKDCKALADSRKCEKLHKGDAAADKLKECKQTARGWCATYDCKAMAVGYVGDCKSSNCKAIVKGDYSYCFQKLKWD